MDWNGRWAGGRTATDRHGRTVWLLERQVDRVRHRLRLRVDSEPAALAELALFDRDPAAYLKRDDEDRGRVTLDPDTVARYLRHVAAEGRTPNYRKRLRLYLAHWVDALAGRDLRAVTLADLQAHLAAWDTARQHRIIALKAFTAYLREHTGTLLTANDPTLALRVPQARPEKARRAKGWTVDALEAVYREVEPQDVRDVLALRARTGLHETEVSRIAEGKAVLRALGVGEIAGTVRLDHKSGRIHTQSLDAQSFAAALRLHALGRPVDNARHCREVRRAFGRVNARRQVALPLHSLGELRHSFVTWARETGREVRAEGTGVPLALVSETIGHATTRTTSRFYDGTQVPPLIVLPLRLVHWADPPLMEAQSIGIASTAAPPEPGTGR